MRIFCILIKWTYVSSRTAELIRSAARSDDCFVWSEHFASRYSNVDDHAIRYRVQVRELKPRLATWSLGQSIPN
ncbi:MAG: hypothetical protein U0930_05960 [Pirellulales bacterium]